MSQFSWSKYQKITLICLFSVLMNIFWRKSTGKEKHFILQKSVVRVFFVKFPVKNMVNVNKSITQDTFLKMVFLFLQAVHLITNTENNSTNFMTFQNEIFTVTSSHKNSFNGDYVELK